MTEIRAWKPRPRPLSVAEAASATRRLDALQAELPTLSASIETVRRDIAGHTERASKWSFIMLGPKENATVLDLILENARRPKLSVRLWGAMLCRLTETGEVRMTRAEMMDAAQTKTSGHVSVALGELAEWGALIRDEESRTVVRWFLNPRIATRLAEHARPFAQSRAPDVINLAAEREKARASRRKPTPKHQEPEAPGAIHDARQTELPA